MNNFEHRQNAKEFAKKWSGYNYDEDSNKVPFWTELIENVFGIKNASNYFVPEKKVPNMNKNTDSIDIYFPSSKVSVEQKKPTIDLDKKESRPSFTAFNGKVTPYEQVRTYNSNLPYSQHGRWLITCNFHEFRIYDTNKSGTYPKPTIIKLSDLYKYWYQLKFIISPNYSNPVHETNLSKKACRKIDDIYGSLLAQYKDNKNSKITNPKILEAVNKICVRLVFCFYADDSGIFGKHNMFHNYMQQVQDADVWNVVLKHLFTILNTKPEDRDQSTLDKDIAQFPYVNGGMFADDPKYPLKVPTFTNSVVDLVLNSGEGFDWADISPAIFGALFESTLNPSERRKGGMFYTSVTNIRKVIKPLFLTKLSNELTEIRTKYKDNLELRAHAKAFQDKLASLTFFDPACGSGNFLTETYLCLRKLENEAIKLRVGTYDAGHHFKNNLIEVSIHQFYGIELNDFAVAVAKTAMWIAESQMAQKTEDIIHQPIKKLPLKTNLNIIKNNALRMNWSKFINPKKVNYIISNPPFVGSRKMNKSQKQDMNYVMRGFTKYGKLDYVTAWYKKVADMMKINPNIHASMVSTNNITNGIQVSLLWKPLIKQYGVHINFAYRRFKWRNAASKQAIVFCVIIGFSRQDNNNKFIVNEFNKPYQVKHINPYLHELPNIIVSSRNKPLSKITPAMINGSKPTDHGYLSKYSNLEMQDICASYPKARKFFRKFTGASVFLKGTKRWCLWLANTKPKDWYHIKPIKKAVDKVRACRLKSTDNTTKADADRPYEFQAIRQPKHDYLLIPSHTSKNRDYVPIGYIPKDVIINNSSLYIPTASHYIFGILESRLDTYWISLVSGRYGPSFRYSADITYNNFPWPKVTKKQKQAISKTAQSILDVRKFYGGTLAELYGRSSMPLKLRKAHKKNDRAVLSAYGLNPKASRKEILLKLLDMYAKAVDYKI